MVSRVHDEFASIVNILFSRNLLLSIKKKYIVSYGIQEYMGKLFHELEERKEEKMAVIEEEEEAEEEE